MLLEGIFLPLTTPFYPDGRVYLKKLEANVLRYSNTPAAGLLILGESGEDDALTDTEAAEVLRTAIAIAAKEKVMLAGVGRGSVFATLALAHTAASALYDAIVVKAPAAATDSPTELLTYFRAVADSSPLPMIILAGSAPLPAELLAELAAHPQIIGAIDAQASPARMETIRLRTASITRDVIVTPVFAAATNRMLLPSEPAGRADFVSAASLGSSSLGAAVALAAPAPAAAIRTRTRRVGFQVLAGSSHRMLEAWQAGAAGAVPALAVCAPQACCEVWQAFKDGDPALAAEKQHRVAGAGLAGGWKSIPALKYGCDLNGYFGGRPRLPLLSLTAAERTQVEAALKEMPN